MSRKNRAFALAVATAALVGVSAPVAHAAGPNNTSGFNNDSLVNASNNQLPVQVWYLGRNDEMPPDRQARLAPYEVECVDADAVRRTHPARRLDGWELKVFATESVQVCRVTPVTAAVPATLS